MTSNNENQILKELLFKMADDQFIMGHRNSEWTGIGPTLEEDISFSSIAQDQVGHAFNFYKMLNNLGEGDADSLGFGRSETEFKCAQFVEYPIGEYDFSLVRHFYFDHAELLRLEMLTNSSNKELADLAKKLRGEVKYHVFHANTWIKQLAQGTEESKSRIQTNIRDAFPLALGIFEPSPYEDQLQKEGIFEGEEPLKAQWLKRITNLIEDAGLEVPDQNVEPAFGGRNGYHTEHLKPLLEEMTEVSSIDPNAEW